MNKRFEYEQTTKIISEKEQHCRTSSLGQDLVIRSFWSRAGEKVHQGKIV